MKKIMAIVNLTPDSFFPDSRVYGEGEFSSRDSELRFLDMVRQHLQAGADIIDLGACSTRPGHTPVAVEEEIKRLRRALELWRENFSHVTLSVDTYHAAVAEFSSQYSSNLIINDISAGDYDANMLPTVARLACPYVAMHHAQLDPQEDVILALTRWYEDFANRAAAAGVKNWIFDPGFGFGKSFSQNWDLLRRLDELPQERPILVGLSRKSMLYRLLLPVSSTLGSASTPTPGTLPQTPSVAELASREETLLLTRFAHRLAASGGASIFRVHNPLKDF